MRNIDPQAAKLHLRIIEHLLQRLKRIERAGQSDLLTYPAGQIVGQMNQQTTVRNVFNDMLTEYVDVVERLDSTVEG